MIETLDDFAKSIFEDEELFNDLCEFAGAMMKLSDARSEATEKAIKRIYGIEGEQK
ncbi:hypothetical protein LCGC14_0448010 [marine sediment metagenome]|uniref:Uncharacterized protein n=1 Tax=marine sediment metagenome TaxID=412755 RepID=A0A0F9V5J6_9ZZZZ